MARQVETLIRSRVRTLQPKQILGREMGVYPNATPSIQDETSARCYGILALFNSDYSSAHCFKLRHTFETLGLWL
jgi:hypothetical protein